MARREGKLGADAELRTQALIHGLNRHYYSIAIAYRKTGLEQSMLLNLHKKNWTEGLKLQDWEHMKSSNEESIEVRSFFLCFRT